MSIINAFRKEYFFLSNFYKCNVTYNGITFNSSEAAFQAQKCPARAAEFSKLDASDAKAMGRHVTLRRDWESVKDNAMYEIVKAKFTQNETLKERLLATGDSELVEGNDWNDKYWGVCNGYGKNMLGKILMRIRTELKS